MRERARSTWNHLGALQITAAGPHSSHPLPGDWIRLVWSVAGASESLTAALPLPPITGAGGGGGHTDLDANEERSWGQ